MQKLPSAFALPKNMYFHICECIILYLTLAATELLMQQKKKQLRYMCFQELLNGENVTELYRLYYVLFQPWFQKGTIEDELRISELF